MLSLDRPPELSRCVCVRERKRVCVRACVVVVRARVCFYGVGGGRTNDEHGGVEEEAVDRVGLHEPVIVAHHLLNQTCNTQDQDTHTHTHTRTHAHDEPVPTQRAADRRAAGGVRVDGCCGSAAGSRVRRAYPVAPRLAGGSNVLPPPPRQSLQWAPCACARSACVRARAGQCAARGARVLWRVHAPKPLPYSEVKTAVQLTFGERSHMACGLQRHRHRGRAMAGARVRT